MKKNEKGLAGLLILFVFLSAILIALFIGVYKKMKKEDSSEAPTTTTIKAESLPDEKPKYDIKLLSAAIEHSSKGEPLLVCEYEWTNNFDKEKEFALVFADTAYQNGIECKSAFVAEYAGQKSTKIQPGITYKVKVAYKLYDEEHEAQVVVKEWVSLENKELIRTTITI